MNPAATFAGQFLHCDLCEMAAAYLFHLVQYHPFIDGNKRVGAVAAFMFLTLNGVRPTADNDTYVDLVLAAATEQGHAGLFHPPLHAAVSDDGCTLHLVFSGDDHFSVRQATLTASK